MPEKKELVINTTPIISLIAATGSLDMLPLLYRRVWVPFEVCREIHAGGADNFAVTEFEQMNWLHKQNTPIKIPVLLQNSLDSGEAAVIALALQEGNNRGRKIKGSDVRSNNNLASGLKSRPRSCPYALVVRRSSV